MRAWCSGAWFWWTRAPVVHAERRPRTSMLRGRGHTRVVRDQQTQEDHSAVEPALVEQLEPLPQSVRPHPGPAADHDRGQEQQALVDEALPQRVRGEGRPGDAEVAD